jgi:hypothetical protein
MSIRFTCQCGKKLKVADDKAGMKVMCSSCGEPMQVPEAARPVLADASRDALDEPPATEVHIATKASAATVERRIESKTPRTETKKPQHKQFGETENEKHPRDVRAEMIADFKRNVGRIALGAVGALLLMYCGYKVSSHFMGGRNQIPDLGTVSGTVTLDGKPLPRATLLFRPHKSEGPKREKIAASAGVTDDSGNYVLNYIQDVPGAVIGQHWVEIRAMQEGREIVPVAYNSKTKLSVEVKAGDNAHNFDLKSKPE